MNINRLLSDSRLDILRSINRAAIMQSNGDLKDFLNPTLKIIREKLDTSFCGVYELNESGNFCFISGQKIEDYFFEDSLIKNNCKSAKDSIAQQNILYTYIEPSRVLYFTPIIGRKPFGVFVICQKSKLDTYGLELLESVSEMLSSAIDKFLLQQQINRQYLSTVKSLVVAIEAKDAYTQGHSQRVAEYSRIIGLQMRLEEEAIRELEITGLVHDIGKIGISDQLLTKPDRLSDMEFDSIRLHPEIGIKILEPLCVSQNVVMGTLLHHKRYDLKGYPLNYEIDKLPLVPSIIGAADAFDAMTSERTYKQSISSIDALNELKRHRGTQFSPDIVDIIEELVVNKKL